MSKSQFLALIPARGGSKRLPRKNILPLAGKPLIDWSIEAALKSNCFSKILVSTDCGEIAAVSREAGADVPFIRPDKFSGDTATSIDVARHAIEFLEEQGDSYEYLVLLQPTSPFRTAEDIQKAIEILEQKSADGVISLVEVSEHPYLANTLPENGSLDSFLREEVKEIRTQDLPKFFKPNGAIYVNRISSLLEEGSFYLSKNCFSYVMPKERSVDIDTELDFRFAKFLVERGVFQLPGAAGGAPTGLRGSSDF
ncbi:hypothetical protein BVY02_00890 [bacterium J17]|nr:hypothetical protein BVY02_00890 [bacterium J17]